MTHLLVFRNEMGLNYNVSSKPAEKTEDNMRVKIRSLQGSICNLHQGRNMQRLAVHWNYVISNRERWYANHVAREDVAKSALQTLKELGITTNHLRRMANAGVVEISTTFESEEIGWEARIMPWEYLLSTGTKRYRGSKRITVVRHLQTKQSFKNRSFKNFSIVETAPAEFADEYDFDAEHELVWGGLTASNYDELNAPTPGNQPSRKFPRHRTGEIVVNPTKTNLRKALREKDPEVIHLTGIDSHLGATISGKKNKKIYDGIYFSHASKGRELVLAEETAKILASGARRPLLVGLNTWHSGARLAPLCVAHGADAAIGFHTEFCDMFAELFFFNFYKTWAKSHGDALAGFLGGWEGLKDVGMNAIGTGIVIWSGRSFVRKARQQGNYIANMQGVNKGLEKIERERSKKRQKPRIADPQKDNIRQLVGIRVTPHPTLNYAMLHNGRSLLKELYFWFKTPKSDSTDHAVPPTEEVAPVNLVRDIAVEVILKVGADSFPFRTVVSIGELVPSFDLADEKLKANSENPAGGIRVPLTSSLFQSFDEKVLTSLYVRVMWHGQTLYEHTHPVSLLPFDEWHYSGDDWQWFPSFVQPRDPAVNCIVDSGQKFLSCLEDNPGAGFSGYQAADVDPQVQAIWSSLIFNHDIHYISPPPVYSQLSQRLRTPSQIVDGRRGTCIDLALLLASCLEWIELYPVVFMTELHAFPGYWMELKYHEEFMSIQNQLTNGSSQTSMKHERYPWISGGENYAEIKQYIDEAKLIPLEAVSLTANESFNTGYETALKYFGEEDIDPNAELGKFEAMFDVVAARSFVTPLPRRSS